MKTTAFEDYEGSAHLAKGKSQSGNVQVVFVFKCANRKVLGCLYGLMWGQRVGSVGDRFGSMPGSTF